MRVALVTLAALALACCGYRPAGSLLDDDERRALVPAFRSAIAYPEIDVYAGSYLASRLTSMGLRPTSDASAADLLVQGRLSAVRETPVVLGAEQALLELVVDVRIEVGPPFGEPACTTPVAHGRANLMVPLTTMSETERQTALQRAVEEAVEALLLDALLCASDGSAAANGGY